MDTIRIGLIGAGNVARARHIPRLQAIEGVELGLVWNRSRAKSERVAREFGFTRAVDDWRELVESPDVDAVVIATPPGSHHEMTLTALGAGKHTLCQARMARNLHEALEMRDAEARSGKVACLYPPLPGLRGDRTMLRLLGDDYVGEIRDIRVVGMAAPASREGYDWRRDPDVSGIHLLTMGMWVEVLQRWVGPAASLAAKSSAHFAAVINAQGETVKASVPDSVTIGATMDCGAAASFHFSTEASFGGMQRIEIYGSRGALVYDLASDAILGATSGDSDLSPIEPDEGEARLQTTDREFIDAIRGGPAAHPSFDEGVGYMEFCEAVGQSVHFGRVVDIPPKPLMATWGRTLGAASSPPAS